jgi:hypothetical protein
VQVNLEDSVTGFSCLDDPLLEACLYQINSGSVDPTALADPSIGAAACGDARDIFDPTMSGGFGWPPLDEDDDDGDICSSTKSATFGQGGKLESCPVGGLSRKWGVLDPFFDQNLAIFNNIIGRSLLVYSIGADGEPIVISCAPIVFESNCHDTGEISYCFNSHLFLSPPFCYLCNRAYLIPPTFAQRKRRCWPSKTAWMQGRSCCPPGSRTGICVTNSWAFVVIHRGMWCSCEHSLTSLLGTGVTCCPFLSVDEGVFLC